MHTPECTRCEHDCPWRRHTIGAPYCSTCDDHAEAIHAGYGDDILWDRTPTVTNGATDTALHVRYPDGSVIPVGVPATLTAREYAEIIGAEDGYTVIGVVGH